MTRPRTLVGARWTLLLLAALAGPETVAGSAAQDPGLAAGVRRVDEGDFEGAVATLGPVADRLSATGGHEAAQACLYLGIAHLALDERDAAGVRFVQALGHEPSLRLSPDRFSPKVIAAFEEARREREAAARALKAGSPPQEKKSHLGRTLLLVSGVAAGAGVAVAASGGSSTAGGIRFADARFVSQGLECPDGTINATLDVGIDLDATNDGDAPATVTSVSTILIIERSSVPSEVGSSDPDPTSVVSPTVVPRGRSTLHVQTSLTCNNGLDDAPRFNEWRGRVTLATSVGAAALVTIDLLRVNIP